MDNFVRAHGTRIVGYLSTSIGLHRQTNDPLVASVHASNLGKRSLSRRLKEALRRVGDDGSSPTRLAREFNRRYPGAPVTLHATRKWLNGEALPSQDKLRVLAEWLGMEPGWLRFGEGDAGEAAAYRVRESTGPAVDFDLARDWCAFAGASSRRTRSGEGLEARRGEARLKEKQC